MIGKFNRHHSGYMRFARKSVISPLENDVNRFDSMDMLSLTKVKSLFILTFLIERDDGQKKQILETPTNGARV